MQEVDFQTLGRDLKVIPDTDDDETLVDEVACVAQHLLLGWTQPTGLSDGTEEGETWGIDVASHLNAGLQPAQVQWLKAAMEVQARRDERIEDCSVAFNRSGEGVDIDGFVTIRGRGPYRIAYQLSANTLALAQVESLG